MNTEQEKKSIDQLMESLPFWVKVIIYILTIGIMYIVQSERTKQRVIDIRKLAITKLERDIMNKDKSQALRDVEFLGLANGDQYKSYLQKINQMDNPAVTTMTIPIIQKSRKKVVKKLKTASKKGTK